MIAARGGRGDAAREAAHRRGCRPRHHLRPVAEFAPGLDPQYRTSAVAVSPHVWNEPAAPRRHHSRGCSRAWGSRDWLLSLRRRAGQSSCPPSTGRPRSPSGRRGMITARGNGSDAVVEIAYGSRRRAIGCCPDRRVGRVVVSPARNAPGRRQGAGMITARGNGSDAARETAHRRRRRAIGCRPISELARGVGSPAPNASGRRQGAGMITARGDGGDAAGETADRHRREEIVVVPSPSWPTGCFPEHSTPPAVVSAQLWA